MSAWDLYNIRVTNSGSNKYDASKKREVRLIKNRIKDNLSFFAVNIDGIKQEVSIINSDNLNEKDILSMPNESLKCGSLVEWMSNFWLITETDANNVLYTKAKMVQCNYLLKWIDSDGTINEQWCVVEDGTKYLTGTYEDRSFIVTRGDSRVAVTLPKNEKTTKLNRESRFLIDDPSSDVMLAYSLTKPLKIGSVYNGEGIYSFVLQEVASTDYDNHELGIADYYKYYPREGSGNSNDVTNENEKGWI